jgi:putative salt-induced outer membrane protein
MLPMLASAGPALAQKLPSGFADLLREATPEERTTLENVAKRRYPKQREAIDRLVDRIEKEEETQVGKAGLAEGWTGEIALGGNVSSGNNNQWNFSGELDIKREGPRWEHRIEGEVDLREVEGDRTEERLGLAYRARRDFDRSRFFTYGSLRFERDRSEGLDERFTESVGGGYEIIDKKDLLDWDVYVGPALRQTNFADGTEENRVGVFLATYFKWEITDTLTFRQDVGGVIDSDNQSLRSTTALTSNIYGRLSGKIDLTIEKESNPPPGAKDIDIFSRLSLAYDF